MDYVYHGIPKTIVGTELLPLNLMRGDLGYLHNQYLEKYKGREEVLDKSIPLLKCGWKDVVQFLPVNPQKLFNAQKNLGLILQIPQYKYYKIPINILDPSNTVIFFKTAVGEENIVFKWLKDIKLRELDVVPPETLEYYSSCVNSGDIVFNYQFVPHILYKGQVDITKSDIIELLNE